QGRARVAAAAAAVELQRQRLAELSITAPSDGQVDALPYRVGERVAPGALLGTLLQGEQAYGRLYIPEQQRANLAIGDSLTLHISGLAQPVQGIVRSIAQEAAFTPYFALNQKERRPLGVFNRGKHPRWQ
ncbi:MAG TPA: HlyD family secretion protein, partial [Cellvibrionaceae bacterium]|nr:HlyD family secretion protein [Cellvibrionaceae bacterium]